ncbi:unnamed protein product [Orchesella dallaii]|uniref:non-specific serine/threonine protein kinase n=1 Tax=Orchesella dallaii TaxID=48710 RepID=A0ABP1S9I5_9HEXA
MLKLLSAAKQPGRRTRKEMSFLRRLVCQGRALLKEYQLFGHQRCYNNGQSDWRFFKIDLNPRGKGISGGFAKRNAPSPSLSMPELSSSIARGTGNAVRSNSPASTLQWVGQEVRRIFVNNILSRVTTNEQIAKQTAQRLMYGDSRPFFALVGVSLAAGTGGMLTQESEFDNLCWEIRESMLKKQKSRVSEIIVPDGTVSVKDLKFGNLIQQGCNAAVYSAEWANNPSEDAKNEPLAVKMLFNYDIESNASTIFRAMVREIVPARHVSLNNINDLDRGIFDTVKRCPPHDNIIEITHAFVDQIPTLPGGIERYPSALPRRLNPVDGLGRNMSLFLVMKRYDCNLSEFLNSRREQLNFRARLLIFTQLLDAVAHLERNGIAHRDLKTDNVLVDLSEGEESPRIVLTDFGCCLADRSNVLKLAFRSYDTERGGNAALMAPEVSTAVPGSWKWISYEKSDVWSVGAMAYEIFGDVNPFYKSQSSEKPLDSRSYTEADLKSISGDVSATIRNLVNVLLKRNANERLSGQEAAIICHLHLWAPTTWLTRATAPDEDEIMQWLVTLTTKALCNGSEELQYRLIQNFLRRAKFREVKSAAEWIANSNNE